MNQPIIFTEIVNCAKVGAISLASFHKYHPDYHVVVVCTKKDFQQLPFNISYNNIFSFYYIDDNPNINLSFKNGHEGTAIVFSEMLKKAIELDSSLIHFDSDVVFKKESLSLITNYFEQGYHIVGSRRCYKNNPSGVKGLDNFPDTISTYFMGINFEKINAIRLLSVENYILNKMCQGVYHPIPNYIALDFFDPVVHYLQIECNATIKYLDYNLVGGQNEDGIKVSRHPINMHMDCGEHLVHFGGVGSGCAVSNGFSNPEWSYRIWSLGRYALFCKLFYNEDVTYQLPPCEINLERRWVSGTYNEEILQQLKNDLNIQD